jgi:Flp pilus assembly protein TadD
MNALSGPENLAETGMVRLKFGTRGDWFLGLVLVLAILVVYVAVWRAGFIWDDDVYITHDPSIVGPLGLKAIWTTSAADISPLTTTTFWLEHALWGLTPWPYHLVNVFMHAACAVVLWRVLRSLGVPGAWLGAALWALHPVEVESVAWVSELKNPESGLFFLLAIFFFLRWLWRDDAEERSGANGNYGLTLLFAGLAMACKSSTVILPVVLGLCAWWMEGRWRWRNVAIVAPVLVLSAAASLSSLWFQRGEIAKLDEFQWERSWPQRLGTAGDAVWFYLGKLLWPHPLMTVYPRWQVDAGNWDSYLPLLAVIVVFFVLWARRRTWARPCFFVFAYFLTALLPVLGLVENTIFRYSLVFDHFQYLASMGPLALAGAGLARVGDFALAKRAWVQPAFCAGLLLVLGIMSWQRTWVYESEETFWSDAVAKNPACWVGYMGLGDARLEEGRVDEAISNFRRCLEINPGYAEAYNNLGNALLQKGQPDEAIVEYGKALEINPRLDQIYRNMGNILLEKGELDPAVTAYRKALEMSPGNIAGRNGLGEALFRKGEMGQAAVEYGRVLALDPDNERAHDGLGLVLARQGRTDLALVEYRKALASDWHQADTHSHFADALMQEGLVDEAISHYREALAIDPTLAGAHNNLGIALARQGRLDEAIGQFEQALEVNPKDAQAQANLARARSQQGRLDAAVAQHEKALGAKPADAEAHYGLGVALDGKGEADAAMDEYRQALAIDPADVRARNSLGVALSKKGELDAAVEQFRKNLAMNAGDAEAHNNLGIALAEKGELDAALAEFREAVRLKPDFIQARDNLAKAEALAQPTAGSGGSGP